MKTNSLCVKTALFFWALLVILFQNDFAAGTYAQSASSSHFRLHQSAEIRDFEAQKRETAAAESPKKNSAEHSAHAVPNPQVKTHPFIRHFLVKKVGLLKKSGALDKSMSPAVAFLLGFFLGLPGILIVYLVTDENKKLTMSAVWGVLAGLALTILLSVLITVAFIIIFGSAFWWL